MHRRTLLLGAIATGLAPAALAGSGHHGLGVAPLMRPSSLDGAAADHRLVVIIMKEASCGVCLGELGALRMVQEEVALLGARVVGLTHSPGGLAKHATRTVGWPVLSDPALETLGPLGFWIGDPPAIIPGIVIYDRCGREFARAVGRRPGVRATDWVMERLGAIDDVSCPVDAAS